MCVKGLCFLTVLTGLAASGVLQVSGMRIYTSGDMEAVNGTDVRLKCTFDSSARINPSSIVVSWTFRPLKPGREESVFHYQQRPYPPTEGIFRKRILWAGDIMGRDASIIIREVKFTYNGTFFCHVKNPPDVHGAVGEIRLRVVTTASFSELLLLALAIGGGITAVVILLIIIVSCRRCKRKRERHEGNVHGHEEAPRKERKDPTACHPSRAVHLYLSETSIEIDSSDGMISEASTKDPSSSEEEAPSSDDDGGDDSD
ncbi:myelin protein zero-like protein 2 [Scomber japonicus]|uniref:myelin protein zero-like protein 2 n=1 Tax=Scomber japonicus TaxID=13676 RepID=UPI002305E7C9|nr:myelin protein zero-like protein 2 [Scomber japonicus]